MDPRPVPKTLKYHGNYMTGLLTVDMIKYSTVCPSDHWGWHCRSCIHFWYGLSLISCHKVHFHAFLIFPPSLVFFSLLFSFSFFLFPFPFLSILWAYHKPLRFTLWTLLVLVYSSGWNIILLMLRTLSFLNCDLRWSSKFKMYEYYYLVLSSKITEYKISTIIRDFVIEKFWEKNIIWLYSIWINVPLREMVLSV